MKKLFLILPLAALLFATQGWAPPPDLSKCSYDSKKQVKVPVNQKDGKKAIACHGLAICNGKPVPITCKGTERDPCPTASKCVEFGEGVVSPIHEDDMAMDILFANIIDDAGYTYKKEGAISKIYLDVSPKPVPPAGSIYRWTRWDKGKPIPKYMILTGIKYNTPDYWDGQFVCRAKHGSTVIPGSLWSGGKIENSKCYIVVDKKQVVGKDSFEVLERGRNKGHFNWVKGPRGPIPGWAGAYGFECRAAPGTGMGLCYPTKPFGGRIPMKPPEFVKKFEDGFIGGKDEKGNPLRICRSRVVASRGLPGSGIPSGRVGDDNICYLPGPDYKKVLKAQNFFQIIFIEGQKE
ncbi:MAG: hypothetical protein DRQ88_00835 [Epsilonproteobacteria bacterium]|nr:MAG: hypothetical protein DRQ89_11020 [Campylobacterota bacterium]RLA68180.1 MAG: hypothetical protein DRQ88_00835 [Campylobacterota bacterium]